MNDIDCNLADHKKFRWWKLSADGSHVTIPRRMYELYLVDYFDSQSIQVSDKGENHVSVPARDGCIVTQDNKLIPVDDIQAVQTYTFNHEVWYPDMYKLASKIFPWDITFQFDLDDQQIQEILKTRTNSDHTFALTEKIQKFMDLHKRTKQIDRWFVRTGGASPKDLFQDKGHSISVGSAQEAIRAVALSMRTYESLTFGMDKSLVIRSFVENMPHEMEFRCFIHKGQLRAISQNGSPYYLPQLQDQKQQIIDRVSKFYNYLYPYIPYEDCTMDIVLWDGKGKNPWDVYLVEFNPFGAEAMAGSSMFSWVRDYEILYNSPEPVLRIVEEDREEWRLLRE